MLLQVKEFGQETHNLCKNDLSYDVTERKENIKNISQGNVKNSGNLKFWANPVRSFLA